MHRMQLTCLMTILLSVHTHTNSTNTLTEHIANDFSCKTFDFITWNLIESNKSACVIYENVSKF